MAVYRLATPEFDEQAISIACDCYQPEHNIRLMYWSDPDDWEAFFSFHLRTWRNPLRRLWVALRYVFGYRCRYGEWDEFLLNVRSAKKLIEFLQEYVDLRTAQTNEQCGQNMQDRLAE
jgi:hypothetical protein